MTQLKIAKLCHIIVAPSHLTGIYQKIALACMVSATSTYISLLAHGGGDRWDTGGAIWVYFKRKLPIQLPEYLETIIHGWI